MRTPVGGTFTMVEPALAAETGEAAGVTANPSGSIARAAARCFIGMWSLILFGSRSL